MFSSILSRKGISLVEVCIALFLLSIGIMAMISLQPSAWRLSGKSDYLGRASGILLAQLQAVEAKIMNPNATVDTGTVTIPPVYASGQDAPVMGEAAFTVNRTITDLGGNTWRVTMRVTWPGNASGISESLIVARQENFRQ